LAVSCSSLLTTTATTYDHKEVIMKTRAIAVNTQVVNFQPTTNERTENCMRQQSNNTARLVVLLAMAMLTLALAAPSASAQTLVQYMQMPGTGNFTSGTVFNLPGYGNVMVTESTEPATFFDQTGAYNKGTGNGLYNWGTDTQRLNVYNTSPGNWDYTVTFTFESGAPDLNKLIVDPIGLALGTTATINEPGSLVGEYTFPGPPPTSTTVYTPGLHGGTFSSAANGDLLNTGWALFKLDSSDGSISSVSLTFDQISGDGVGFTLGYASPAPEPTSLALFGSGILGLGGLLRRRFLG
jgi:PEP-CTERM motif-containing protein